VQELIFSEFHPRFIKRFQTSIMFASISRAVLALFLATPTVTAASPVLQGRFYHYQHHRHLYAARKLEFSSNSCLDAFDMFHLDNPALDAAYQASQDDFISKMLTCQSRNDCNLDQDTWDSSATLSQACNDAGGTIYKTSFTSSCEFSLDGVNLFEGDIEVVNQHDCFPPTCTREHIVSAIEDYANDEGELLFEDMQNGEDTTTAIDLDGGCNTTVTVADAQGMVIYQDGDLIDTSGDGGGSNNDGGGSNNDGGGSNDSTSTASNLAAASGMLMLCVLVVVGLL
jgi:hypothetical protein